MFGRKKKNEVLETGKSWYDRLKNSYLVIAVAYVVFGMCLLIKPDTSLTAISFAIGTISLIYAIATLIKYFLSDKRRIYVEPDFILPIVMIVVGLIVIFRHDLIEAVISVVVGIVFVVSGIVKLQDALNIRKTGYSRWWIALIFALVSLILGVVMLSNVIGTGTLLVRIIGLFFTIDGLLSISSNIMLKMNIRRKY